MNFKDLPCAPLDEDILEEVVSGRMQALLFRDPAIEDKIDPYLVEPLLSVEKVDDDSKSYGIACVFEGFTASPELLFKYFAPYLGDPRRFVDLTQGCDKIRIYLLDFFEPAA